MMTRGGEGGKKCQKFDDVILCEQPLTNVHLLLLKIDDQIVLLTESHFFNVMF